jgi:hypothetical protein
MQRRALTRSALLAVLLAGLACARNKTADDEYGSALDTAAVMTDSAKQNQAETGMTDSTRQNQTEMGTTDSTGRPVTSKGDTVNPSVDSSTTAR